MDAATKLAVVQEAVAQYLDDWAAQGGTAQDIDVWLNADSEVCIWVNGGGTIPSASGEDAERLKASVADYLQSELMEAEVAYRILPTCPTHAVGLHAQVTDTRAGWWCRTGEHLVAHIGSLPATGEGRCRSRR